MHGQTVLGGEVAWHETELTGDVASIGDVNAGMYGRSCETLLSYAEGGPVSIRRDGHPPLLNEAPRPSLYRAPTDNDRGNGFHRDTALWRAFTELAAPSRPSVRTENGALVMDYAFALPSLTDLRLNVCYTVLSSRVTRVRVDFPGGASLPDLPSLGLSLRLPRALSHVRYYGLGPEENERDRQQGALLGIYETSADECYVPYSKPQACGDRMGVRWLELTDDQGRGLRVRMAGQPLSVSVLPYSQAELAAANRFDELPTPNGTYVDVASARYGVAGDDSWGAPALEPYRLHADQPLTLEFYLEVL